MAKGWLCEGLVDYGKRKGVGGDIAAVALEAGDRVVAGARRTKELAPLAAQYGEYDLYQVICRSLAPRVCQVCYLAALREPGPLPRISARESGRRLTISTQPARLSET
jgi:hypothetical protein